MKLKTGDETSSSSGGEDIFSPSNVVSRIWVGYDRADQCLAELDSIYNSLKLPRGASNWNYGSDFNEKEFVNLEYPNIFEPSQDTPLHHRHRGMVLTGPSSVGKTSILIRFMRDKLKNESTRERHDTRQQQMISICPIVMINTGPVSLNALLRKLLISLKTPIGKLPRGKDDLIEGITNSLIKSETRMVILDEFQNILTGVGVGHNRSVLMKILVHFSNDAGVALVLAGTEDIMYAIDTEDSLCRRLHTFKLKRWEANDDFQLLVERMAKNLGIECTPLFDNMEALGLIYEKSEGLIGEVADFLEKAISQCDNRLTLDFLQRMPWDKQSDRRSTP